jgi:membrane protein implicated in regulation of membrane protease activity
MNRPGLVSAVVAFVAFTAGVLAAWYAVPIARTLGGDSMARNLLAFGVARYGGILAAALVVALVVLRVSFARKELPEIERDAIPKLNLVGAEGVAQSNLYPRGAVRIDGVAHEARSRSGPIDEGTPVRVVAADQFNLIVEAEEDRAEPDR